MNILTHISRHLLEVIEGGNWTEVSIIDVLRDVSVQEANLHTKASPNTIASIVHHLVYWNHVMVQRIDGTIVDIPDTNGFDVPVLTTEQEWANLKNELIASGHELAKAVSRVEDERLTDPILPDHSSTYKNLQGTVEHMHYHLGQIVILKKLIKAS